MLCTVCHSRHNYTANTITGSSSSSSSSTQAEPYESPGIRYLAKGPRFSPLCSAPQHCTRFPSLGPRWQAQQRSQTPKYSTKTIIITTATIAITYRTVHRLVRLLVVCFSSSPPLISPLTLETPFPLPKQPQLAAVPLAPTSYWYRACPYAVQTECTYSVQCTH